MIHELTRPDYQTSVTCHHYASYRLASNFALPDDFIPERWLVQKNADMDSDQPRSFTNDRKDAFHPFLPGPRTCLGKVYVYNHCVYAYQWHHANAILP